MPHVYNVPCAALKRLSSIIDMTGDGWLNSLRIEGDKIIALSDEFLIIERLPFNSGSPPVHIKLTKEALEKIAVEAEYNSNACFSVTDDGEYVTLQTDFGYKPFDNFCAWSIQDNPTERWKDYLKLPELAGSKGGMFWNAHHIALLASAAPSGLLMFPENVHFDKPAVIRDVEDENWFAVFIPTRSGEPHYEPATLPEWVK